MTLDVGSPAPDIVGENLSGGPFSWANIRGSKSAVVVFPTAAISPTEIVALRNLYVRYADQAEFITFQKTVPSIAMARMFIQQMGVTWPVILDREGENFRRYGVVNPPVVYFVDQDGVVVGVMQPEPGRPASAGDIEAGIKQYLHTDQGGD